MALIDVATVISLIVAIAVVLPAVQAQGPGTAPAPPPTSDVTAIDQGIAYVLMLLALALTYIIHPLDAKLF